MKTELWYIGKSKFKFVDEGVSIYSKRISKYLSFQLREFPNLKTRKNLTPEQIKSEEASMIFKQLKPSDHVVLLDEKGKRLSSKEFASFIESQQLHRTSRLIFLIGGAYGFDQKIYDRSNYKLSLSDMTFSHQLVKLIFMEQLYRAMTILRNHPYHNE